MIKLNPGDRVKIRAAGTNKPSADPENLWEVVSTQNSGILTIRNVYDMARARLVGNTIAAQPVHISMLWVPKKKATSPEVA